MLGSVPRQRRLRRRARPDQLPPLRCVRAFFLWRRPLIEGKVADDSGWVGWERALVRSERRLRRSGACWRTRESTSEATRCFRRLLVSRDVLNDYLANSNPCSRGPRRPYRRHRHAAALHHVYLHADCCDPTCPCTTRHRKHTRYLFPPFRSIHRPSMQSHATISHLLTFVLLRGCSSSVPAVSSAISLPSDVPSRSLPPRRDPNPPSYLMSP